MGKKRDVEAGVVAPPDTFYYYTPPPPVAYPPPRQPWLSWLVPLIFIVDVVVFVYTMYVNNCPETYKHPRQCLFRDQLGRFSFMPFSVNPLLGPSTATLEKLGGLRLQLVQGGQRWRLLSCLWLHAGAIHLVMNMMSLLFIGVKLEEEFGCWRIGPLYVISGFGGSLMSCLNLMHKGKISLISVGASGALFGLLGAMLSELIANWTIYANKCTAFSSLVAVIAFNLALGLIPGVDSSAHIGGFLTGFLLGFILLIRPQYGYINRKYLPPGTIIDNRKPKHGCCQYFLFLVALVTLIVGFAYGWMQLFNGSASAIASDEPKWQSLGA